MAEHPLPTGVGPDLLVLIHEMGGSRDSWAGLVPLLDQSCAVLAYDLRGSGDNATGCQDFSIAKLADDLAALLTATAWKGRVLLVGAAFGAAIAVRYALDRPTQDLGLVLISPALWVAPERRSSLLEFAARIEREGAGVDIEARLARSYPVVLRGDTARFEALRAKRLATNPAGLAAAMRVLAGLEIRDELHRIRYPTLVIAATFDGDRPPEQVRDIARRIPGATQVEIPAGHFAAIQAPERLAHEILVFLSKLPSHERD